MSWTALGVEWTRAPALAALLAVPIVWWWASKSARPESVTTGTLDVWREVARETPIDARARRRTSLALACLLAALACGALALAGPRAIAAADAVTWRVVLDRSPSMYLPVEGARGPTRFASALNRARELLADATEAGDSIEWIAADDSFTVSQRGAAPPSEWSKAPRSPANEPTWALFDRPATLWVTDRAPDPAPRYAGWCASGGALAPGTIAFADGRAIEWPSGEFAAPSGELPSARWSIAAELAPVRAVFDAWKASRSIVERAGEVDLELAQSRDGDFVDLRVGRDGWSARVKTRAVFTDTGAASQSWLSADLASGAPIDVVRARPGRIEIAIAEMSQPDGDPAAFAVSWAKLFDDALLPPRGAVAVGERQPAGEPSERAPIRGEGAERAGQRPFDAWLALAAAACAVAALSLRR